MKKFWKSIIEPLFKAAQPAVIVEIGSEEGINTLDLLKYCRCHRSTLYVIEPEPHFDVTAFQKQFGEHLIFLQDISLNVLSQIPQFDAVLIDGDHNWYTVFHELCVIESYALREGEFPLVLMHDVCWPYARRDLYYQPERIPAEYRQEFQRSGVLPGRCELVPDGANNRHYHALLEGAPRCGVLTAAEDFLKQTKLPVRFITLPGFNGLGLMADERRLSRDSRFKEVWDSITLTEPLRRHFEMVEAVRLERLYARK
jgi:hypothetical protein